MSWICMVIIIWSNKRANNSAANFISIKTFLKILKRKKTKKFFFKPSKQFQNSKKSFPFGSLIFLFVITIRFWKKITNIALISYRIEANIVTCTGVGVQLAKSPLLTSEICGSNSNIRKKLFESISQPIVFFEETVNKKGLTWAQLVTCHIVFVRGQWVGSIFSIINGFIIEWTTVLIRDRLLK